MDYLERDGLRLSRIGFGSAAIGGYDYGAVRDAESVDAVRRALETGITLFDTADVYGLGHSESVLAQGLGDRRRDAVIATKVGVRWDDRGRTTRCLRPDYIRQAAEASLRRLGIDCIPIYQIHWPDPDTPLEDSIGALVRLQEEGKIRWIGLCNAETAYIDRAQATGRLETLQVPFNMAQPEQADTMRHARERHAMLVMAYNVLAQGLFTGKYGASTTFEGTDLRRRSALFTGELHQRGLSALDRLTVVGARHGRKPGQIALRWVLDQPVVDIALAGMKSPAQVDENSAAHDCHLTDIDRAELQDADRPPSLPRATMKSLRTPAEAQVGPALSTVFEASRDPLEVKLESFPRYARRKTVTRFITLYELFKLALPVKGSVVECGVFQGFGLMTWAHLSAVLEPANLSRRIYGFDSFDGFPSIDAQDQNRVRTPEAGELRASSEEELRRLIEIYDQDRFLGHIDKVHLVKGDAASTIPPFIQEHPHLVVSLLYMDFDLFEPTKVALQHFLPRMPKGAILAFDELDNPIWPGETLAALETLGLRNLELKRFAWDPYMSYAVI